MTTQKSQRRVQYRGGVITSEGAPAFKTGATPYVLPLHVERQGRWLAWTMPGEKMVEQFARSGRRDALARPKPDLLLRFAALSARSADPVGADDAIAQFAFKHGPLFICRDHAAPCTHVAAAEVLPLSFPSNFCPCPTPSEVGLEDPQAAQPGCTVGAETVESWRFWSRQASAILALIAKLRSGDRVTERDLSDAITPPPHRPGQRYPHSLLPVLEGRLSGKEGVGLVISASVNLWLRLGAVHPTTFVTPKVVRTWLGGAFLFGTLATQLFVAATAMRGLAICAGCGAMFDNEVRPRFDRQHYCTACGRKVQKRDAQRRYRQKKAAKEADSRTKSDAPLKTRKPRK